MDKIKKGLGRGLSSLIGDTKTVSKNNKISVSDLIRNRYQPRKTFDEESLEELTNSIKSRGIIQPIIARPSTGNKYEILLAKSKKRPAAPFPVIQLGTRQQRKEHGAMY